MEFDEGDRRRVVGERLKLRNTVRKANSGEKVVQCYRIGDIIDRRVDEFHTLENPVDGGPTSRNATDRFDDELFAKFVPVLKCPASTQPQSGMGTIRRRRLCDEVDEWFSVTVDHFVVTERR